MDSSDEFEQNSVAEPNLDSTRAEGPSPSNESLDNPLGPSLPGNSLPVEQLRGVEIVNPGAASAANAAGLPRATPIAPRADAGLTLGGLYVLLGAAGLLFGLWFVAPRLIEEYHYSAALGRSRGEYENAVTQLERQPLSNVSQAYQLVAQRIRPSVVSINAVKSRRDPSGLGSGVIMSSEGHIMTNAHVLEDATRYFVELHDRRRYEAELIGTDTTSDLALLKIDAPSLIPATWGDSDRVDVGSIVWAIGSPYGFQQTVTSGILSGKDRPGDTAHQKQSLLQTDAAVNPGNSGGPLVDEQGHVIGINTSIFGETFQGISFAVPSATAKFVYQQLVENGSVTRGYLGVIPTEVSYNDVLRFKLPDLAGARLRQVMRNSPAYIAGIRPNDIIRRWDGVEIREFKDLFRLAEMTPPQTPVEVVYFRDGQEHSANVTVGTLPNPEQARRVLAPQTNDAFSDLLDLQRSFDSSRDETQADR